MSKTTNIVSLTDDIIFDILVRVPAQDVHSAARLVCRKWYQMIRTHDFKHAHFKKSAPGFLVTESIYYERYQSTFFAVRENSQIETYKLSYESKDLIWSSCNGLILELEKNRRDFYITNPATAQRFALPPILVQMKHFHTAIAFAATSMAYKVVGTFHDSECAILSVGVDKDWRRRVSTEHLSLTAKGLLKERPITTEGFVHWAKAAYCSEQPQFVLTLNVETEIITQIRVPYDDGRRLLSYHYFAMGSKLSLLVRHLVWSLEVWEMRPDNGEWTHMLDIQLEPVERSLSFFKLKQKICFLTCSLKPVGWLKLREVLAFSGYLWVLGVPKEFCIAYNVRTRGIDSFELDFNVNSVLAHKNSLVWLDDHC